MRTLSGLGVSFVLVLIVASMAMNYFFMSGWGKTEIESYVFGGISVAFDGFKSLLPVFIASAVAKSQYSKACIGSVIFVGLLCFALVSAIGFAAGNRGAVTGGREALTQRYDLASKTLADVETRLDRITTKRTPGTIQADMAAMQQEKRWRSTKGCVDTTANKSIRFCKRFFALKAEHEDAIEARKLRKRLDTLRPQVSNLKEKGAGKAADPQAGVLAKVIPGFEVSDVQTALTVLIALLVEAVAAFGLYLSTGHGLIRKRRKEQAALDERQKDIEESQGIEIRKSGPKQARLTVVKSDVQESTQPERFNFNKGKALISSS